MAARFPCPLEGVGGPNTGSKMMTQGEWPPKVCSWTSHKISMGLGRLGCDLLHSPLSTFPSLPQGSKTNQGWNASKTTPSLPAFPFLQTPPSLWTPSSPQTGKRPAYKALTHVCFALSGFSFLFRSRFSCEFVPPPSLLGSSFPTFVRSSFWFLGL